MNVTIRDAATLRAIRPAEAAAYLRGQNWKHTETIGDKATVWTKSAGKDGAYEIVLLLDPTLGDYARRMGEVMQTLQAAEQRSQLDILRDISVAAADVVRIRLQHGLIEGGAVPLDYAVAMVEQARELLLASACAAVRPRALYAARKPQEALNYLRGLRMGQTEQGSFVLNIQSPVTPRLQTALAPVDAETYSEAPFERRALLTLSEALAAAHQAATSAAASGAFDPFTSAVRAGVSANLCGAIAALGMDDTAEEVTIDLRWSSARPVAARVPTHFRFGRDTFPLLREAAKLLRESSPIEDYFIYGPVTQLKREEDAKFGRVTISRWFNHTPRNVSLDLSETDYEIAARANINRDIVTAVGDLVKEGRTFFLRNVRDFSIDNFFEMTPDDEDRAVTGNGSPAPYASLTAPDEPDPFADE